jgi:hypothetical protein
MWDPFHIINEVLCHHSNIKKLGWTCASLSADFIPEIKDVILSRLDELLDLSYIDKKKKKLEMSSFQCNLNSSKISHVTLDIFKEYTMI